MSHSGKPETGIDTLSDRFRDSLGCEVNKPDFRELDLGSPVSPLRTRQSGLSIIATTTSSSSSSGSVSGRKGPEQLPRRPESAQKSHSGELSCSSENSPTAGSGKTVRNFALGPTRSETVSTHPAAYSGQSSVNSPPLNVLPTGNICPSGRILKTGMATPRTSRTDVLGSGTGNYGHGSIIRGGGSSVSPAKVESVPLGSPSVCRYGGEPFRRTAGAASDPEELKRVGNEHYRKGQFLEALGHYDKAISISPGNAACRSNRAAALMCLGQMAEAVRECEVAVNLDPKYCRAHQRLVSLFIRLGQVENAKKHLRALEQKPDQVELSKLQTVERHLLKCADARKVGCWKVALKEADTAIAAGADFSPQLFMCRVEALLKLHHLEEAQSSLKNVPKLGSHIDSCAQTRFFGMLSEAYLTFVLAQMEMALGRFDCAVSAAEKAGQIDPQNLEVSGLLKNVRLISRARAHGNDLFKSERFTEACSVYGEGLKVDPSNSVLYCNRAACWFKLGLWEQSIEDCNNAIKIQPNYTKALLRRAASKSKLEKWADAVRDYEVLRRELPDDKEVAESLFHAQVALKKSLGEEVVNMQFGGDVEEVSNLEQFKAAISLPGVSVVHFKAASSQQCNQISPFLDTLCSRYPSVNFLKVDVEECPVIASAENARIVPTFKIYKNGNRVKEIVCPSQEVLEHSVRHYSL